MMAFSSTNLKNVVSHALSLTRSSSKTGRIRNSRSGTSSSSPLEYVVLTAPAQCCSFSARSARPGGCSLPSPPTREKFCRLAQFARTTSTTKSTAFCSAEEIVGMALPAANCSSELEPILGQVSSPPGVVWRFIASLIATAGRLLGSAGNSGRGDIQGGRGAGGGDVGEEKVGAVKDLLRLGCALVTPGVGSAAASGHWWSQYVPGLQDIFAGVVTLAGAMAFLQIFNELAKRDILDKKLSRKLVHIGVGLGFMPFWPLFTLFESLLCFVTIALFLSRRRANGRLYSASRIAPYLAALAPGLNTLRLWLVGLGLVNNEAFVKSMTREGDRRELLKGPFYYGLTVVVTTVAFWRTSPVGIVALVNLCAGDGFADIIGRNFGTVKLPYNHNKSIAGSVAFFIMSSLVSMLYLSYFAAFGFLKILPGTLWGVLIIGFCTAVVESLPISTLIDDNFTVPFTAIVLGMLLLPVS